MLELVGVGKRFGNLDAAKEIDLDIKEGEIRGLIGPNGAGKTTLFNLISGFLKPTAGKIIWQGHNITGKQPHYIAERGLVRTFQLTVLLKSVTALQNVIIAHHLHTGIGLFKQFLMTPKTIERRNEIKQEVIEILDTMGIVNIKDELAGEIPHGLQRALGIAIALAAKPKLLLLDEPVTGMTPVETRDLMERINKLHKETGITILIIEHNMRAVMTTCEKITVMSFGEKIAEGTPEEISKSQTVIEAYLGKE